MSGAEKAEVLNKVASSGLPKRRVLGGLGVPRSTYYRWLRRKEQQGLDDDAGGGKPPWNRASQEVDCVLSAAREMPELSCRQLAAWITDNQGFSVSESTVYRILRREGLVRGLRCSWLRVRSTIGKPPVPTRCGPPMPPTSGWWVGATTTWNHWDMDVGLIHPGPPAFAEGHDIRLLHRVVARIAVDGQPWTRPDR